MCFVLKRLRLGGAEQVALPLLSLALLHAVIAVPVRVARAAGASVSNVASQLV